MRSRITSGRLGVLAGGLAVLVLFACQATHEDVVEFERNPTVSEDEQVERLMSSGLSYLKSEIWDEAEATYSKVIRADDTNRTAYKNLAFALRKQNKHDEALSMYQRYTTKFPDDPDGYALLAATYDEDHGNMDGAIRNMEKAASLDPENKEHWVGLGFYKSQEEDLDGAIEAYEKAYALDEEDEKLGKVLQKLYGQTGRTDDLLASIEEQVAKDPENVGLLDKAAKQYREGGDFGKAAEFYGRIAELDAENAGARRNQALCLIETGDTSSAVSAMEAATTISGDADDLVLLSELQASGGIRRYSDAIKSAQRAIEVDANHARGYCAWGKALERIEKYEQAKAKFERAAGSNDPVWSSYALQEIVRQDQLIERREKLKARAEYDATEEYNK